MEIDCEWVLIFSFRIVGAVLVGIGISVVIIAAMEIINAIS